MKYHFMQRQFSNIIMLISLPIVLLASCNKIVDIDPPKNSIISSLVFENDDAATHALSGIYSRLVFGTGGFSFANGSITLLTGMSGDELFPVDNSILEEVQFNMNTLMSDNPLNFQLWQQAYTYLYHVNSCIEGIDASAGISASGKKQLTGECKFLRAFLHFYLVNLYGDVPLVTTTNWRLTSVMKRTSKADVFLQIIADLKDAESLLAESYIGNGRTRPNKYTAIALLSRAYLYKKEWLNTETEATKVINQSVYSLVTDLNNIFKANSNEAIWQLMPVNVYPFATWEGKTFVPTLSPISNYSFTSEFYVAFEPGDNRKIKWINYVNFFGFNLYFPYKYKVGIGSSGNVTENYMMLRIAEQYLIRAEARAHQNNISGAQADINMIRYRAGLGDTPANDKTSLLDAIEKERRSELFAEWGHRWFDLKRTNRASAILTPIKGSDWSTDDMLYPIPVSEIQVNPNLKQNPGY